MSYYYKFMFNATGGSYKGKYNIYKTYTPKSKWTKKTETICVYHGVDKNYVGVKEYLITTRFKQRCKRLFNKDLFLHMI